jgi:hypothetical protein
MDNDVRTKSYLMCPSRGARCRCASLHLLRAPPGHAKLCHRAPTPMCEPSPHFAPLRCTSIKVHSLGLLSSTAAHFSTPSKPSAAFLVLLPVGHRRQLTPSPIFPLEQVRRKEAIPVKRPTRGQPPCTSAPVRASTASGEICAPVTVPLWCATARLPLPDGCTIHP